MALIKKCCCRFNIRSGSVFAAFFCLVSTGLFIGLLCVRYVGYRLVDNSETYAIAAYATIALFGLLLVSSIALIVGVYMDIQTLFVPWLVICVICIVEGCALLMWFIIDRLRNELDVPRWEVIITAYHVVNSICLVYCIVCVLSQLQDLMAGKGTSRYYRRRRQLRRQRLPPHITPMPIELLGEMSAGVGNPIPPLGVHPPGSPPPYFDHPPPYSHSQPTDNTATITEEGNNVEEGQSSSESEPEILRHGGAEMYAGSTDHVPTVSETVTQNINRSFENSEHNNDATPPPRNTNNNPTSNFHFGAENLISAAALQSNRLRRNSSPARNQSNTHRNRKHAKSKDRHKHRRASRPRERAPVPRPHTSGLRAGPSRHVTSGGSGLPVPPPHTSRGFQT